MALLKCPDCGKMVSERASVCPECGCPKEYFNELEESINANLSEEKDVDLTEENDEELEDPVLEQFSVLGTAIFYFKFTENYINIAKLHSNVVYNMENEVKKIYSAGKDIDVVWDEIVPMVQCVIDKLVKENVGILYNADIIISEKEFKNKYTLIFFNYLKELEEEYNAIIHKSNQIREAREYERAGRGHWEGGGFGVRGAIKGAITAGAFNMVADAGRAIGDSVVDGRDEAALKNQKVRLYNDKRFYQMIIERMRLCLHRVDIGMAEELASRRLIEPFDMDYLSARKKIVFALNYEKDKERLAKKAFEILRNYPFEMECYLIILEEISNMPDEVDELIRFIKFWNLESYFSVLISETEQRKLIMEYIHKNIWCQKIDFNDYSPDTYKSLKRVRKDFDELIGKNKYVTQVPFCNDMKNFFSRCMNEASCMNSLCILDGVNDNTSIEDIVFKIHAEKVFMPEFMKGIWVKGDEQNIPEEKIKKKWKIELNDTIYMYQNSAIFGTAFGGAGFFLTNSLVCDLKSKTSISLNQIKKINLDESRQGIDISDGTNKVFIDLKDERKATRYFLLTFFNEMIMRGGIFSAEQKHTIMLEQGTRSIEAAKEVKMIYCPYCGNKIMSKAKFCNFCGQSNSYRKEK